MSTTAGSSVEHVPALACLPPETQVFLFDRDEERLQLKAELAKAKAALSRQRKAQADNALNAGDVRSQRKREAVLAMANDHLPQLRVLRSQRGRAMFLHKQIASAIEHNNGNYMGITTPPHWRTIASTIKDLQLDHE